MSYTSHSLCTELSAVRCIRPPMRMDSPTRLHCLIFIHMIKRNCTRIRLIYWRANGEIVTCCPACCPCNMSRLFLHAKWYISVCLEICLRISTLVRYPPPPPPPLCLKTKAREGAMHMFCSPRSWEASDLPWSWAFGLYHTDTWYNLTYLSALNTYLTENCQCEN